MHLVNAARCCRLTEGSFSDTPTAEALHERSSAEINSSRAEGVPSPLDLMSYIVVAYIVMAYIVAAYIVMACIVMAAPKACRRRWT